MKVSIIQITFIFFLVSTPLIAIEVKGNAYGETFELARNKALASLSESIYVEVKSTFTSSQTSDGQMSASNAVFSTSSLPLLGVEFIYENKGSEKFCAAFLDSNKSLKLYQVELDRLFKVIELSNEKQQAAKNKKIYRYRLLSELITEIEQFSKYRAVAQLLGDKNSYMLPVTSKAIRNELLLIESVVPSLDIAAELLTRDLPGQVFFVQPVLPLNSRRPTELSRVLKDRVESKVGSIENSKNAEYILKGSYEILDDEISVTYRAIRKDGMILATRIARLAPESYQNIDYKPKDIDFDRLLHEGYAVSNEFRAELSSNQGKTDLLFQKGDALQLLFKLNHPGYLYIVAHNEKDHISYLLELNSARGNRAFVRYVNADDVNRWMSLGHFEVTAPYGTESLQLIASSEDVIDKIPAVRFDRKTGLYLVKANSMSDAVKLTRSFKPKNNVSIKAAEATLTYTTMDRIQ